MARAGVETARTAFVWSLVQPHGPGASCDFSTTDALAVAASRHGITLLPVVQTPPAWAAMEPGVFASPPEDLGAVRRFSAALVERYGPRGSLWRERPDLPRRPIRAWQVFNEPNIDYFWSIQPFARHYVATLRAAAKGIRSADPGATVVLAGLVNESWRALRAVYAAGARGSFDAVAIHPYTSSPANVLRVARYARRVMRANGDRRLPIWVTEFSWPAIAEMSNPPGPESDGFLGGPITNSRQARLLNRTMRLVVDARRRLGIARLVWYTWLSHETPVTKNVFAYAGLRRIRDDNSRNTPAVRVFRRWARRLEGCAKTTNAQDCR